VIFSIKFVCEPFCNTPPANHPVVPFEIAARHHLAVIAVEDAMVSLLYVILSV
jgi:hypothetical protein